VSAGVVVGFTGPRDLAVVWRARVAAVVSAVVAQGHGILVGDAAGADAFVFGAAQSLGVAPGVFRPAEVGAAYCPLPFGLGGRTPDTVRVVAPAPRSPAALAARSAAMVSAVAAAGPGSFLVGFVSSPCPQEKKRGGGSPLSPSRSSSRCFAGYGSGTWASLAFAGGLGLRVVIVPCGLPSLSALPTWWGRWAPAGAAGVWSLGWSLVARP